MSKRNVAIILLFAGVSVLIFLGAMIEAKEDKSLVGVKIKVSSHQLGSFYRISGLMLPSFLTSAFFRNPLATHSKKWFFALIKPCSNFLELSLTAKVLCCVGDF